MPQPGDATTVPPARSRPITTPPRNPELIYKIATADAVAAATSAGTFPVMPIDETDGYIHFSTGAQLPETLRLYFAGQDNIVLLAVRTDELGTMLIWEPSRGGQLFPHVYGAVPPAAVAWTAVVSVDAAGNCPLPEWVR